MITDSQPLPNAELTCSSLTETPIFVEVGTPPKTFHLREKVVRASSGFFQSALKPQWNQGQGRTIKRPEDDPAIFNIYANWLQTNKLFVDTDDKSIPYGFYSTLISAYVLGDELLDISFRDAITDVCAIKFCTPEAKREDGKILHTIFGCAHRQQLYDSTVTGAPLRRLLVRCLANIKSLKGILASTEPKELLYEVAIQLSERQDVRTESYAEIKKGAEDCQFHEHEPGVKNCYRTRCE